MISFSQLKKKAKKSFCFFLVFIISRWQELSEFDSCLWNGIKKLLLIWRLCFSCCQALNIRKSCKAKLWIYKNKYNLFFVLNMLWNINKFKMDKKLNIVVLFLLKIKLKFRVDVNLNLNFSYCYLNCLK